VCRCFQGSPAGTFWIRRESIGLGVADACLAHPDHIDAVPEARAGLDATGQVRAVGNGSGDVCAIAYSGVLDSEICAGSDAGDSEPSQIDVAGGADGNLRCDPSLRRPHRLVDPCRRNGCPSVVSGRARIAGPGRGLKVTDFQAVARRWGQLCLSRNWHRGCGQQDPGTEKGRGSHDTSQVSRWRQSALLGREPSMIETFSGPVAQPPIVDPEVRAATTRSGTLGRSAH